MISSSNRFKKLTFASKRPVSILQHEEIEPSSNDSTSSNYIPDSPNPSSSLDLLSKTAQPEEDYYIPYNFEFPNNYDMDNSVYSSTTTDFFESSFNWLKDDSFSPMMTNECFGMDMPELDKDISFF